MERGDAIRAFSALILALAMEKDQPAASAVGSAAAEPPVSVGDRKDFQDTFTQASERDWSGECLFVNPRQEALHPTLLPRAENHAGAVLARFADDPVLLGVKGTTALTLRAGEAMHLSVETFPGKPPSNRYLAWSSKRGTGTLILRFQAGRGDQPSVFLLDPIPQVPLKAFMAPMRPFLVQGGAAPAFAPAAPKAVQAAK